jgi:Ni,Fe-hydrogenase I cytochrome b subunit
MNEKDSMTQRDMERILIETLKISRENTEMLKKIDNRQKWSRNFTVFYWLVIIALALTGYYFAFPYLQTIREEFGTVANQVSSIVRFSK